MSLFRLRTTVLETRNESVVVYELLESTITSK